MVVNDKGRTLTIRRSRLYRGPDTETTVKWQRPHIAIRKHLGNGQFNPPSHLSAVATMIVAGIAFEWEGRPQTREDATA